MPRKIRPVRIEGDIAYVTLTQGYEAIIDASDAQLIGGHNWYAQLIAGLIYACTNKYSPKRKLIYLHRFIMADPYGFLIDHIDGNGLNNRKNNLRKATVSQNQQNRGVPKNNTTGFKGVCFSTRQNKYKSSIKVNGTLCHLGFYDTPEEAHASYCRASLEMHPEFGRTE